MASEEEESRTGSDSSDLPVKKQRFYFESDMLALKSNPDYQKLLKTLAILEAQKIQSIKDLETLSRVQVRAEKDPQGFVRALKDGTLEPLPTRQKVAELPEIDWKHYIDSLQSVARQQSTVYRHTRKANSKPATIVEKSISTKAKGLEKSSSYRQAWSPEEQARFEELLQIYPPEAVEMRRFEKISAALKTRTPQQVASHVQKYFIKLAKAGLPVPGKVPSLVNHSGRWKKSNRAKRSLNRPSTFFSGLAPKVYMTQSTSGASTPTYEDSLYDEDSSDDDTVVAEWVPISGSQLQSEVEDSSLAQSVKCSCCDDKVVIGAMYWECTECPEDRQTQLCIDCVNSEYRSSCHSPSHDLQQQSVTGSTFTDSSYTSFTPQLNVGLSSRTQTMPQLLQPSIKYNYLDPNFYPAS